MPNRFNVITKLSAACALAAGLALSGCERAAPVAVKPASGGVPTALPTGLFLGAAPAGARDIRDAKDSLRVGDSVVLVGRIGGGEEPFVAERAMFTIVDRRMLACGEGTVKDNCKTPWDFCCEPIDDVAAQSATIRVVGADGQPMKVELNGVRGLKPLATVFVSGKVAGTEAGNLLVNAAGLYINP